MTTSSWVTLAVFDTPQIAAIALGRLRVEGIDCVLVDRSLLQLGIVADGIELRVAAAHLEPARAVLARDYAEDLE